MAAAPQHTYGFLQEQAEEDALHASRLLTVEERPFQRATRSLVGKDCPLKWPPKQQLPSPPPENGEAEGDENDGQEPQDKIAWWQRKIHEDILLDFVALESSTIRIQQIQDSNKRERERYAVEKAKILETAQAVRENSMQLRVQLAEARQVLEQRKGYDDLARKLLPDTGSKRLKPRETAMEEVEKLRKEIDDLRHEVASYRGAWAPRREAFDRVVAEGQAMIRQIKGIKDEPEAEGETEKDARMEDGEGDDDGTKGERSQIATPMPEGATPLPEIPGGETPLPEVGDQGEEGLSQAPNRLLGLDGASDSNSLAPSPAVQAEDEHADTEMDGADNLNDDASAAEQVATPAQDIAEEMDES